MRAIGAGAGFAGDRMAPALRLASSGLIDDLALECLAERTMVHALRRRARTRDGTGVGDGAAGEGFDPRLAVRFRALLPLMFEHGFGVVSNLGAADPVAAGERLALLADELGQRRPRIAVVVGDDVDDRAASVEWLDGPPAGDRLGAHAYIGSTAIAAAFAGGAEVVLTGRAADSALFAGALRRELDGTPDALAGALVAGHLLECTAQLTGGNFVAPGGGGLSAVELAGIGYPLACVEPDGTLELGLAPGEPGRLDRLTATVQLLYEVHDPARYITPDGIVDLTGVRIEEVGPNRVRVGGARLAPAPDRLKVSGFFALPGFMVDAEIGYGGPGALDRARRAGDILRLALADLGVVAPAVDLVGVDSLLGPASSPLVAPPPEVRVHVSAACADGDLARDVEDLVFWLTIGGPGNGGGIRVERRDHVVVADGRIDRTTVTEEVVWIT